MESQTTTTWVITKHGPDCTDDYCYCYDPDLGDPLCECGQVAWRCICHELQKEAQKANPVQFSKGLIEEVAISIDTSLDIKERHLRRLIARYQAVRDLYKGEEYEPNLRQMVRAFYGNSPMRFTWQNALAQWGYQDLLVIMREELKSRD